MSTHPPPLLQKPPPGTPRGRPLPSSSSQPPWKGSGGSTTGPQTQVFIWEWKRFTHASSHSFLKLWL